MTTTEQPTWRDYSLHQYGDGDSDVSVLCRSDGGCEDNQPNADGRYLTLGEAVDWAQKHAADHAKWDAEVAADDLAQALTDAEIASSVRPSDEELRGRLAVATAPAAS